MKNQQKSLIFQVNGHNVEVIRKKVLHLRLTLYANGIIRLSAPKLASSAQIQSFLESKSAWLEKNLAKLAENQSKPKPFLLPEKSLFLWGKKYKLILHEQMEYAHFRQSEDTIELFMTDGLENSEFYIVQLYTREVQVKAAPLLDFWTKKMNLKPIHYSIRTMKSRWGSCTPNTCRIRLNTWLASYLPLCLEYVIVHELCHFFERNHGPGFYKLMETYLPDWESRRQILKEGNKER